MTSYQHLFTSFLNGDENRLHFAAHSHHAWPDCTYEGQKQYWQDSNLYADLKWEKVIFPEIIPCVQRYIAKTLNVSASNSIAFAPNTHEFVLRLLSCLPSKADTGKPARILTTNGEFHSFSRQIKRYIEAGLADVTFIDVHPHDSFEQRFEQAVRAEDYDLIFFSHVFFNSGYVVQDLEKIINAVQHDECLICVDGYHSFMALPIDISALENRIFYIGGGYKYAMAGEGCCFIHVPKGYAKRPVNSGWYAEFGALGDKKGDIPAYAECAMRFMGATFDPSGLYRMKAVFDKLSAENISVSDIHSYVHDLQIYFLQKLEHLKSERLNLDNLMIQQSHLRGHFLTFQTDEAAELQALLQENDIITDYRDDRLRFGFGIYQDNAMIDALFAKLQTLLSTPSIKERALG
jgi:selenocysteine lyase/cysteine desulfurase